LQKYIWNGKSHLSLKDLWEYLNRYIYLPRLKNRAVLAKAVQAAISGMLPGPFAYAERWDESSQTYYGLAIDKAANVPVVIDSDSVIIKPDVALAKMPVPQSDATTGAGQGGAAAGPVDSETRDTTGGSQGSGATTPPTEKLPTRFVGTVMISPDRPARDIHQIVEAIVEQLTTLPGSEVLLKLEIDAEVPGGLDRAKVRTLIENATTLGFIDKAVQ
jgi:uncharacterized protein